MSDIDDLYECIEQQGDAITALEKSAVSLQTEDRYMTAAARALEKRIAELERKNRELDTDLGIAIERIDALESRVHGMDENTALKPEPVCAAVDISGQEDMMRCGRCSATWDKTLWGKPCERQLAPEPERDNPASEFCVECRTKSVCSMFGCGAEPGRQPAPEEARGE